MFIYKKGKQMLQKKNHGIITDTTILVIAIVLLAGVIAMTYGFVNNNSLVVYLGVFVTSAASFTILLQTVIQSKSMKTIYTERRKK